MSTIRRMLVALTATILGTGAMAQSYPGAAIRVVVPFPPGGGTDIIARGVTQKVTEMTGWTFVVENKPGAGGGLGMDAVAKAPADGHTLVLGQTNNIAINPALYAKLPYNPQKDLAPIGLLASAPMVIVVAKDSGFKNLADLVAAARAKPGGVNFASSGNGTVGHLTGEQLQRVAGMKFQHVPYKGANQALTDVMGGQVDIYISSVPTVLTHIKNGKLRALAATSAKRINDLPDTPTVSESGYQGFDAATWFGFLAPAGTPKDIVARLNDAFNKALKQPDLRKRIGDEGADVLGGTPEQFAKLISDDTARWGKIVKEVGTNLD